MSPLSLKLRLAPLLLWPTLPSVVRPLAVAVECEVDEAGWQLVVDAATGARIPRAIPPIHPTILPAGAAGPQAGVTTDVTAANTQLPE